jgi:uncharacterized protein
VSFFAFFKEVGWRAWLLPRLVARIGMRRGVVLTAVIWAFWHMPYVLSGIHHLDGVSIARTALILPIGIVGSGLIIGWLWIRTESIWIVSLAHGALNNWGKYAFKYMREGSGSHDDLVLAAGGVAILAVGSLMIARGLPTMSMFGGRDEPASMSAAQPTDLLNYKKTKDHYGKLSHTR